MLHRSQSPQEHETEYGTHWNFFLTIGLLPVLSVLLHPFMRYLSLPFLGMLLAVCAYDRVPVLLWLACSCWNSAPVGPFRRGSDGLCHARAPSHCRQRQQRRHHLFDWYMFHSEDASGFSLIACELGYLAIHLLGLFTGTLLLPPSPSYFRRIQHQLRRSDAAPNRTDSSDDSSDDETPSRRRNFRPQHRRENDKTATELFSYAAVWWTLFAITSLTGLGGGVSRRVVRFYACLELRFSVPKFSGQPSVHSVGRSVQHHFPTRIPSA